MSQKLQSSETHQDPNLTQEDVKISLDRKGRIYFWNPELGFGHNEELHLHPHFPSRQENTLEPGCGFHSKSEVALERILSYPGRGSNLIFRNPAPAIGFLEEL